MVNFKYNKEREILEVAYLGLVTIEDLAVYGIEIMNNKKLPRFLNILTDARQAEYDYKNINYRIMTKNMKEHLAPYIFVKNAILHSKPVETAVSMIVQEKIIIKNYKQKVFYTEDAAIKWLNSKT